MQYGLAAHPLVRWLISSDSGVYDAVRAFIAGAGQEYVDVAGPPTFIDRLLHSGRADTCPLPTVRLHMKMAVRKLTGEEGVEVTCSDDHLEELKRWQREALPQKMRKAQ